MAGIPWIHLAEHARRHAVQPSGRDPSLHRRSPARACAVQPEFFCANWIGLTVLMGLMRYHLSVTERQMVTQPDVL